jgi:dihydroorotase/N-acyl-D-amino-acid deacylase
MPILLPILLFAAAATPYDLVIRNGHVIDGTGSPWYAADIGIRAGKIAGIGRLADAPAKRTIDARGMVVAPGFIDMLGQSEMTILVNPQLPSKIFQGITTEITGEGSSIAPLNDAILKADHIAWEHWRAATWHLRDYFARLRKQGRKPGELPGPEAARGAGRRRSRSHRRNWNG